MKRLAGITAIIVGILVFSSATSVSWEGRAVIAEGSLFPSDGRYARSRVFSRGEMVEVYNPANETKTSVVIVGPSDVSGVLIMLSPQAAAELSISEGYDAIVRVNKKQLYSEPSILPGADTIKGESAVDPDTNPKAAVESRAPASYLAGQPSAETIPIPDQPSPITLTGAETPVIPATVITDEPKVTIQDTAETIPLMQAQSESSDMFIPDEAKLLTLAEPPLTEPVIQEPALAEPPIVDTIASETSEEMTPPIEEIDEPILYTGIITEAPLQAEPLAITDEPIPDFTDPLPLYSDEPASEEETAEIAIVDGPIIIEPETASIPELTQAPEELSPSIPVDIGDGEFILIPTDMLPPELVHTMGTASSEPADKETSEDLLTTEAILAEAAAELASDTELTSVAELASAKTREPLRIPEELSSFCITELEKNSYYIQLASLKDVQNITAIVYSYGKGYPIKLRTSPADICQVLVGPLSKDEYGSVLSRFKKQGFSDAFVRGNN
ncbi:MAG: hypothetical protein LBU99_02160 [Spirochaetaceae bacterium]|nr:hypothetical protein [Spirochaetaceae bacterium]